MSKYLRSYKNNDSRIQGKVIKSLVPAGSGAGTYRYNHEDCPDGEDTKKRLYITVPTDQPWTRVAFCHNCGSVGYAVIRKDSWGGRPTHSMLMEDEQEADDKLNAAFGKYQAETAPVSLQWSGSCQPEDFSAAALRFLGRSGISTKDINMYDIRYNTFTDSVEMYLCADITEDNNYRRVPVVKVIRPMGKFNAPPKYIMERDPYMEQEDCLLFPNNGVPEDYDTEGMTCVIVEDMLSAIKCTKAGYTAYPLLGVHTRTEQLFKLADKHQHIVIWLDNDNETVVAKAKSMEQSITMLFGEEKVRRSERSDPKNYTTIAITAEIHNLIEGE